MSSLQSALNCRRTPPRLAIATLQFAFLLVGTQFCQAAVRVEAYRGEPFGIGRVTIDLSQGASSAPASDDRCTVVEEKDRVLYPVVENKSSRGFLRGLLGLETPLRVTYFFMFRGDDPLDLTAYTPAPQKITVHPTDNPKEFNKLLDDWWNATEAHYQEVFRSAEYPAVVDNYLTATWARRLNRQMPEPQRYLFQRIRITEPWLSQLLANEEYQTQVERDLLLGKFADNDAATIPLPSAAKGEVTAATVATGTDACSNFINRPPRTCQRHD